MNEIITGKRGITVESAKGLSEAFGTSAQLWLNMESAYRLSLEKAKPETIARKAAIFEIAPVRAMVKRNWIEPSTNIEVLEQRLREFFGTSDLNHLQPLPYMARKSTGELTTLQTAWLYRVRNLAKVVHAEEYSKSHLKLALIQLKKMLIDEANIRLVPKILADAGIKFLIVEPLPQSKIDGISFWLDNSPVVALSLRYDRIDSFWHTLIHELAHILNEDGRDTNSIIVDVDLDESYEEKKPYEIKADEYAVNFLVPQAELEDFIARTQPLYSKIKINRFARRIEVHPGIVLGQLHHRAELDYSDIVNC